MPATPTVETVSVPRVLVGLAIDYLRWTQFVPMITAWAFLLLMVGAMLFVNFQQQSFSLIEWGATTYERIFGPIEPEPAATRTDPEAAPQTGAGEANSGVTRFSGQDFMPWVLKAWALMALAGWLLGMLRTVVFGPRESMRLKRKLALAAIPAAACVALFGVAYFLGSEEFHGSAAGWMLMFTGFPLGVWLVSVYSLSVTHGLEMFRRQVLEAG